MRKQWRVLVGLVLGLLVGLVVGFMAGGNQDRRYSVLGALLVGVGVAFGEVLIFAAPGSWFVYEFDFVVLFIYGLAVFEGWVTPQRTTERMMRWSHLIGERNWWPILGGGVVALMLLIGGGQEEFGWRGVAQPLLQRRIAPFWAGLVVGIIWAAWHIPAFLMSETVYSAWSAVPYFGGVVALSVIGY